MKKPTFTAHYLVLKDLIAGIDPRQYSDSIRYLTSRVENIKCDLKKKGLRFDEEIRRFGKYASYKPYVLIQDEENLKRAKALLDSYGTPQVISFLNNCKRGL